MNPPPTVRPPLLAPALILLAVSLVCSRLPLLNVLGYEFSAAIAVVSSLLAGTGTAHAVARNASGERRRAVLGLILRTGASYVGLLLIPLAVICANAFAVRNCSWSDGLLFFLLLPVVSVLFSTSLGGFCGLHYRHSRSAFLVLVMLSFVYALALGYWTPAVFSYNFFYGYFPGLTYDEALVPDRTLILFRLVTLVAGGVVLWMAMVLARTTQAGQSTTEKGKALIEALVSPRRLPATLLMVAAAALLYAWRGPLGFEAPAGFVRAELGGVYRTSHFTIYYPHPLLSGEAIRRIGADHEFRLYQITTAFHLPSHDRFTTYLYPSDGAKKRLIGAGGTAIAKPWSGEAHLSIPTLDRTLKHELVHLVAARFGIPLLRASTSTGLVEGLAMAVEWDWGNRTLHRWAAGMRTYKIAPDIRPLMSLTGFASHASSVSYVLAGSFCRFLIDRWGMRSMMLLYRSADYPGVYGRDLDALIGAWEEFLDGMAVPTTDREAVDAVFRSAPMMQKECARVIAARNSEASQLFARREYRAAAELYRRSYEETGGEDALGGLLASALRAGDIQTLLTLRDAVVLTDEHPGRHLASFVSLGLASWSAGDTAAAVSLFRRVERADVFEERTEAAALCRLALQDPLNSAKLLDYFVSGAGDSARLALLEAMTLDPERTPVPLYLKAKLLVRGDRPAEALSILGLIDLSRREPRLEALRRRTMGICLCTMGNYQNARAAFWTSLNHRSDEVWQLRITEWIDRCEWESERTGQGMLRQSPGGVGKPGVPGTNGLREHDATVVAVEADRPGSFPAPERNR